MRHAERFRDEFQQRIPSATAGDLHAEEDMLIVVRHGDAGDKGRWEGPDLLRPLSLAGRRQAEGLVLRLEDYPVERILSSPTMRCRQTVEPLAQDRLLQIESVPALGVDAGPAQLRTILSDRRLRDTVLCTHGETIGQLFTQLARDGLEVEEPLDWPKGSTWLLQRARLQVRAQYLPPLALDPVYAR
jgi:phosphohistidine phosphatase SixA